MSITELIERAHSNAKAKGFWDQERNTGELLMLIVSECGEALEAHRKGNRANLAAFDGGLGLNGGTTTMDLFDPGAFIAHIKGSFEEELSDIVIGIADLCGAYPEMIKWMDPHDGLYAEDYDGPDGSFNVGEQLLSVVQMLVHSGFSDHMMRPEVAGENLGFAMREVFSIAQFMGIDIERHVELKLAYNATRPRLHDKAY